MALNVGELVATLTVDDSRYTRAMQNAEQSSQRMAQTATETGRTVQRSNEQAAQSYQQLSQETQRYQQTAQTAQSRARNAIEARTVAEENLRDVQRRTTASTQDIEAAERRVERARQEATRATERAETASDQFIASQRRAARETEQFGDAARNAEREVRQLGQASDEAAEQSRGIGEGVRERLEGAFGGVGELAGRSGSSGGGSFLSEFSGRIGGLAGKGGPIAMALVGVAAIGLAAGAVLANAIADGMEQEKQEDLIQAKLGINEETARRIGQAAGAAYSNGWGESVEENMDAARAAIQAGLLTGEEDTGAFKATIEQLNIAAGIMDEDIPALARSASQAVKTGFAQDGTAALDMFVKAQQVGLNTSEDFLDTIDEYGIQFKKLGLEGPEAMGLLSQAVKGGARDTDTAADALKEFSIRAIDGSKSSAEAFELLGMNAEDMTAKISNGGQDAKDGLAAVLTGLREMEPGVDRTTAAVGLFGTKAEDMGDALYDMNLDRAVMMLGEVDGAAAKAGDTMSSNTAASFESASRSIETSADDIKLAMAQAFGPALQDAANWVSTHKPEIIGFFTGLADAGFATLDAMLAFSSGALRAWAQFADGIGGTVGRISNTLAGVIEMSASAIDLIPGMGDAADEMHAVADGLQTFGNNASTLGDKARGLADTIDGARPTIQGMREDVARAGQDAQLSAELMRALGTAVVQDIPDEKSIIIDSNSPEQQAQLEALGLKVERLPDGNFVVTSNTDEGQRAIDVFVGNNNGKSIDMFVNLEQRRIGYWQSRGVSAADAPSMQGPVPVVTNPSGQASGGGFADGAVMAGAFADGGERLPSSATIQAPRMNLIQWAEPETEGEAFIPLALSKRARSLEILSEVARKFGMSLLSEESGKIFQGDPSSLTNETDPTGWRALLGGEYNPKLSKLGIEEDSPFVNAVLGARDLIVNGNYDGRLTALGIEEDHPLVGSLLDFNRAKTSERTGDVLQDIAKRFGLGLVKMADGGIISKDGHDAMEAWAYSMDPVPYGMGGFSTSSIDCSGAVSGAINTALGLSPYDSRMSTVTEGSWLQAKGAILGKGPEGTVRVGWWDEGGGANGHTAMTFADGTNFESNGSEGVVVGGDTGWDDPSFTDHAWFPNLGDLGLASDTGTGSTPSTTGTGGDGSTSDLAYGTTESGALIATDGQRVFVTNWPTSLGGDTDPEKKPEDERVPILTAGLKVFANGGYEDHSPVIVRGGDIRMFGEPETEGESYIPHAGSKRARATGILSQTANKFGYRIVPMADGGLTGFGGWQNDDRPTLDIPLDGRPQSAAKRRANANNLLALGIGGLNTLLSGFDGKGNFTGQFDTGSNSPALLEEGVSMITAKLDELIEAAKNPDPVDVQVDIDQGSRTANLAITKRGL